MVMMNRYPSRPELSLLTHPETLLILVKRNRYNNLITRLILIFYIIVINIYLIWRGITTPEQFEFRMYANAIDI